MNNQLEKLVNTLKVIGTIDNIDFSYQSEKYHDDYYLNIKILKKHSNNEAMLIIEEDVATMRIKIRIDSSALFKAYSQLNEDEKIPEQFEISNPCKIDAYMNNFVERDFLNIIQNLKSFNSVSDNYEVIARLLVKYCGDHFGKEFGI